MHSCGVCFLASFLPRSLLPRGRDETSQEEAPIFPRGPGSRFLPWSVNRHGGVGGGWYLTLCLPAGRIVRPSVIHGMYFSSLFFPAMRMVSFVSYSRIFHSVLPTEEKSMPHM